MSVLIDSGVWIAFYNTRDQYHDTAVGLMSSIRKGLHGAILSSDYILNESVNYCLTRYSPDKGVFIGEAILSTTHLLKVNQEIFDNSWQLFKQDKKNKSEEKYLSFTDCTSIILAKAVNISFIATFDARFKKYVSVFDR